MISPLIDQETALAVARLQRQYGHITIAELPDSIDELDRELPVYLAQRIGLSCERLIPSSKRMVSLGPTFFKCGGLYYQVMAGEGISTPGELELLFVIRDLPATRVGPRGRVEINEPGRYRSVLVQSAPDLNIRTEDIERLAAAVVEASYRWLKQFIEDLVKRGESALTRELYTLFRGACVNAELRDVFVFGAVSRRHVIYLLDAESAAHSLASAVRHSGATHDSPTHVLAEILTAAVPYDVSLSKPVVEGGRTRVVSFHREKYANAVGPVLSRAEAQAIGTVSVAIRPIGQAGDEVLLGVAPAPSKDQLERTISAIEKELADSFASNRDLLHKAFERLRRNGLASAGDFAEWAGRFTGGILHAHH